MKIAIAQTIAHADLEKNFKTIEDFTRAAKSQGAELICFPEMAYFSGKKKDWLPIATNFQTILDRFCQLAKTFEMGLIPGTLREPSHDSEKFYNTLPMIDSSGKLLARYRKIFLYKAVLPDKTYDETQYSNPGNEPVTINWKGICFGLAICFDLRFPELFRALKKRGAQITILPSAFTVPTGEAHWEVLIRARAIENQFFMLAPGLTGTSGDETTKYGHSLIVAPWGQVKAQIPTEEGFIIVDIDLNEIGTAENKVPAWNCRREELFQIS